MKSKLAKKYAKDIFCLEGDWLEDLREKPSIYATLAFLETNRQINNIYRHCGTKETLFYYLSRWKLKKYNNYSILYFAFHGFEGQIQIGKDDVTLEEISDKLENKCKDKVIFFGSCLVMTAEPSRIKDFLVKTGALCVCGYKESVDFVTSSAFEMLVLDLFQQYKDISCVQRDINLYYAALAKKLDFKIYSI